MDSVPLLLIILISLPYCGAIFTGPLHPEISNGTFHHFFVPDGDYEENDDPDKCQMLFRFADERACGTDENSDSFVRDDFIILKHQVEDAARMLENIGRTMSFDLDGEDSYGKFLRREITEINEAFTNVDKSLLELEVKFKQSQDTDLREEHQLNDNLLKPIHDVRGTSRDTMDLSVGLKDKHDLLSLIIRSHGTRLNRLKTEYLRV
ncbi:fin bud initiation factor a [Aplochiton taeniatus]